MGTSRGPESTAIACLDRKFEDVYRNNRDLFIFPFVLSNYKIHICSIEILRLPFSSVSFGIPPER